MERELQPDKDPTEQLKKLFLKASDSTVYLEAAENDDLEKYFREASGEFPAPGDKPVPRNSYSISVITKNATDQSKPCQRRILACRCDRRRLWSVTIRSSDPEDGDARKHRNNTKNPNPPYVHHRRENLFAD